MNWLYIGLAFVLLSWFSTEKWKSYFEFAIPLALIFWLMSLVDLFSLGSQEESLLQWFAIGLAFIFIAKIGRAFSMIKDYWSYGLEALAAFSYAIGFDVFRPDAYARIPAILIALLILLLAIRVGKRILDRENSNAFPKKLFVLLQIVAFALMLYSSIYKLMDRTWSLPWSYLVAVGAFLFILAQLWKVWKSLDLTSEDWSRRILLSFTSAQILIVGAAYFHYAQFL